MRGMLIVLVLASLVGVPSVSAQESEFHCGKTFVTFATIRPQRNSADVTMRKADIERVVGNYSVGDIPRVVPKRSTSGKALFISPATRKLLIECLY